MDLQWMPYKGNTRVGFKEVYDWNWPKQYFSQFDIELFCFREKLAKRMKPDDGGVTSAHHFKEIAKALWPEEGKDGAISFIWNPWADKLLEYSCKENFIAIAGGAGWGKCLAPHVEVLMHDGSKKMATDVVLGDKLMGDDSQPRTVVHRQDGRSNMVRIKPVDNSFMEWECNDDHILTLSDKGTLIDISVKDYIKKYSFTAYDRFYCFSTLKLVKPCGATSFFSITPIGEGDWSGFKVDGNGRFLLADGTITHNSEFFAIWAIVNFLADPKNTLVFVTSTTLSASKKRIWGKIAKYWSAIDSRFPYGKLVDSEGMIRYIKDGVPVLGNLAGITLVPAEKKKEKDAMGKIQGMHQERIIFIADEHSEISEAVAEAAIYNLKLSASFFQFIGISNPASYTDAFGSFAKPKDGWESISVEHDEWETERGVCLHFDLTRNPNVMAGRKIYGWMPSQEDIDAEMKVHGGNTSGFWRMYRGFWVPAGVDDNVFTEVEIINSKAMQKAVWLDNKLTRCSFIDPSFTNGGDRTVACFGTFGTNMEGLKVLQFDEWLIFQEDVTDKTLTRSQQVASWWRNACIQRQVAPRNAGMDVTGAGGPLSDMIAIVWSRDIFKLNFGGKASELPVSAFDPTPSHERYVNSCTEIWFSTKEYMLTGQIKGIDKDCMREMVLRKIDRHGEKNIGLRLKVLPKSEMKSKHGFSPDYAEAALGLCALARERLGFHTREGAKAISSEPENTTTYKKIFDKWKAIY